MAYYLYDFAVGNIALQKCVVASLTIIALVVPAFYLYLYKISIKGGEIIYGVTGFATKKINLDSVVKVTDGYDNFVRLNMKDGKSFRILAPSEMSVDLYTHFIKKDAYLN